MCCLIDVTSYVGLSFLCRFNFLGLAFLRLISCFIIIAILKSSTHSLCWDFILFCHRAFCWCFRAIPSCYSSLFPCCSSLYPSWFPCCPFWTKLLSYHSHIVSSSVRTTLSGPSRMPVSHQSGSATSWFSSWCFLSELWDSHLCSSWLLRFFLATNLIHWLSCLLVQLRTSICSTVSSER